MPRFLSYWDLEFDRMPIEAVSSGGTPFTRWVPYGMPRIPDAFVDSAFYLYRSEAEARDGDNPVGTGFLIARRSKADPAVSIVFAVTNYHVVYHDGGTVPRIMRGDGEPDTFPSEPQEWFHDPKGPDVVLLPLDIDLAVHRCGLIDWELTLTPNPGFSPIGLGDDVFMIGCFIDPDRGALERPTARFGNISMLPAPLEQPNGNTGPAYLLDMHSRSGYSGSPVFMYRTRLSDLSRPEGTAVNLSEGHVLLWLGIHVGQFNEYWDIVAPKKKDAQSKESNQLESAGHKVKGVSGMTMVVPAAEVLRLLEMPDVKKAIQRREDQIAARPRRSRLEPEGAGSDSPATKGDDHHKERFTALLDEAVGKPRRGE